jgi:UDP-N-acetylmuramoyl-L-alanyl-D-glutamate--2,6-diaminopimelate ligase
VLPKIYRVACHTDNVGPATIFVAIPGKTYNGVQFIEKALDLGAREIVVQQDSIVSQEIIDRCSRDRIVITYVENARKALAELSAREYHYPARQLKIIGVTGTKGKTTTVYLLRYIFREAGFRVAMLSGVENFIGSESFRSDLTTPQPDYIHMFFDQCIRHNIEYVVMEASAQAFSLNRLETIMFDGFVFTNFSLEHSEFYRSLEDYFAAKCEILNHSKHGSVRVINANDFRLNELCKQHEGITSVGFNPEVLYQEYQR